ncbi:MAG: adenylate/guanylate cyclase domain-containing protein [Pseudomonadota bacterium]|nr:adenylate/guanylate cyclase domain-containing protein [Pseudomonadota bacterium]
MKEIFGKLRDNWARLALSTLVLVGFLVHATGAFRFAFIDRMENLAYDSHLQLTMPNTLDDSIVIVDIDEGSLTAEGRWPWPRDKLARLVENLFEEYEVTLVGLDIVFAEADESSGLNVLEDLAADELLGNQEFVSQLQIIRPRLDYDGIFAQAIQKYDVILGYYFNIGSSDFDTPRTGLLPEPVFEKSVFQGKNVMFLTATGYGGNIQALSSSALGAGHFTQQPDRDGVVRRVPMLVRFEDQYYASLSLEVVRHVMDEEMLPGFEKPLFDTRGYPGLESLKVGSASIPVDRHVKTLVPFRGGKGSFPYVPATQVLHAVADKKILKDRIVLLGTSAPGLFDLRATPMEEAYPGVEVHANLIAGILGGTVMEFPEYTLGAEVIMLVVVGAGMILAGTLLSPLFTTLYTGAGIILYVGFNHLVWANGAVVLPVASGILMVLTMFLLHMSYGYFVETRGKRQITGLFGQYIPPELVDEMAKAPTDYSHAAESRELTVLFSDVRSFTTMSEGLSPTDLSDLMNQFLTPMTGVIHDARGTIDKYMGDAIMAFWGAPLPDPDHPRHALEAGIAMLESLGDINKAFRERGWPDVRIGVGVNTGMMSVGDMGSEFRMAYTVLGDAVNLGSRLEGLTKEYGVSMIVGETTKAAVPEYAFRELDRVRVKGKAKPVAIFEPLCRKEEIDKEQKKELKLYAETIKMYRAQQWDMAELNFVNLQQASRSPDLYKAYVERIKKFRQEPPPGDWDGVFDHKTK